VLRTFRRSDGSDDGYDPMYAGDLVASPQDLCQDVVCDTPPADDCLGDVVQQYGTPGTCEGGVCVSYPVVNTIDCAATPGMTCLDGACVPQLDWPAADEVIFTEVMQNPDALLDDSGEWFELYNTSTTETFDLTGCVVSDLGSDSHTLGALSIGPAQHLTLAISADPGFVPDYAYTGINLGNGADELVLTCGGTEIDSVLWDGGPIHRRRSVQEYLRACAPRLTAHRFPAYAPELNPDEFVWTQSKQRLANLAAVNVWELESYARRAIRRIGRSQALLRACIAQSELP